MKKTVDTTHPITPITPNTPPEVPKLPHERDESVGMTGGVPSEAMQQAYLDVKRGLRDTSRGTAANRAYEKLKQDAP